MRTCLEAQLGTFNDEYEDSGIEENIGPELDSR